MSMSTTKDDAKFEGLELAANALHIVASKLTREAGNGETAAILTAAANFLCGNAGVLSVDCDEERLDAWAEKLATFLTRRSAASVAAPSPPLKDGGLTGDLLAPPGAA